VDGSEHTPIDTLKIEHAQYILTVDPERRIVRDGTILIEGQRVTRVGKAAELAEVPADRVIDAHDMVVTPGFCNGHMHISYAHPVRGIFPDDVENRLGYVFQLSAAMTEQEEYDTSLLAITELLMGGTTCFVDPGSTRFIDACMQVYEDSGCRIIIGDSVQDRPNEVNLPVYETDEAIARIERAITTYDHRLDDRVRAWAMPFSSALCSEELLTAAKQLADTHETRITLHHLSPPAGRGTGQRPTEVLDRAGILGPNVVLSHGMNLQPAEVELLAQTGTSVVMCPGTVIKGGGGIKQGGMLPELLAAGVPVGLGSDSVNSAHNLDIIREMNLAATLYKDARQDRRMIPPETALELATIRGAQALGLADDIGSIEVGKKADLVLFDTMRPEWRALNDPVSNLVYSADRGSVHTVVVDGKVVVEDHQPTFADVPTLIRKVQRASERLLSDTGVAFPSAWPIV
jgi:cytosine/adenosine deaminase-related metal-dependent hydrolase